jgi:CDP-diacylglycerol--glycerol-3-phosphate 3-phosphatidyltransferase
MDNATDHVEGGKITVTRQLFTLSNLISFSRLFVAFPIVWIAQKNGGVPNTLVAVLVAYGILSDAVDGFMARKMNQVSELGKALDPIADKLMALVLFLYTFWLGRIPVWFLTGAIVRDLLIVAGSAFIRRRTGKVAMAVMSGKISVNILAVYWVAVFFFPEESGVHQALLAMTTFSLVYSFGDYVHRLRKIWKGEDFD